MSTDDICCWVFSSRIDAYVFTKPTASAHELIFHAVVISGPPMAKERVSFKIGNLGDTLRLQCPIDGYPAPFFEWKKV